MKKLEKFELDFCRACEEMKGKSNISIAFSGGIDSVVLTHLYLRNQEKLQLPAPLLVHVQHHKNNQSRSMAEWCHLFAERTNTKIVCSPAPTSQLKSEHSMRQYRYHQFEQLCPETTLLLAHHNDDQCETNLFQLIRGSGLRGLCGIQQTRQQNSITLYRPLLQSSKALIKAWAAHFELDYFDDPSNQQIHYSRNYIRHVIVPTIEEHFPNYQQGLAQSLSQIQSAHAYIESQLSASLSTQQYGHWLVVPIEHGEWFCQALIQSWLPDITLSQSQIITLYTKATQSAHNQHIIAGKHFYFYKGMIFRSSHAIATPHIQLDDTQLSVHTNLRHSQSFTIRPYGKKTLKKIFQELQIPQWIRPNLPIVCHGHTIVCVPFVYHDQVFIKEVDNVHKQCSQWLRDAMHYQKITAKPNITPSQ